MKKYEENKRRENSYKRIKNRQKGITLVALVITIVILIILALVAINYAFGDNGIVKYADEAKFKAEKASAREEIELVLLEAGVEKTFNSEYDENEFLDDFVEARLEGIELSQDEVTYKGFIFALDRRVPRLGDYTGLATGPRIKEIRPTGTTTNSISIEVDARNAEGGKYTYWYKKEDEEKWIEAEKNVETNTYTYEGLEENVRYKLKVKLETKEGSIEKETIMNTGEMPKGTIQFTDPEWIGDGTAKVTISTSAEIGEKYKLQYIIIKKDGSTEGIKDMKWEETTSGSEITGLYHGDSVYGRLYDGVNESDYAYSYILDNEAPIVNVTAGGTTTNSVTVSVNAVDEESGMKENPTYTYSIKVTGQDDNTYTTPSNANGITSNSYTFTGLTQETSYDIKVEVDGDKAGIIGTGTIGNQTTGKVEGPTEGLITGNIVASSPTWSNGQASIILTTNTGMQIQYQVNNTTGNWTTITSGGTVTSLNHNDTVYARLYDGNNHGDYASVTIQDKIAPVISEFKATNVTYNSITVQVNATDAQSGIATYTYTINGGSQANTTSASHTFSGLTASTPYTIQVTVTDRAGHATTETKTISTTEDPNAVTKVLKAGDYVTYPSSQGNLACRVLYDSSSGYGVQLITSDTVTDSYTLGTREFSTSKDSYNNAVTTLNNAANNGYNNSTYSTRARCVGSHPTSTSDNPGYFTSSYSYMSSYNGQFKNTDTNYEIDYNQMETLRNKKHRQRLLVGIASCGL